MGGGCTLHLPVDRLTMTKQEASYWMLSFSTPKHLRDLTWFRSSPRRGLRGVTVVTTLAVRHVLASNTTKATQCTRWQYATSVAPNHRPHVGVG